MPRSAPKLCGRADRRARRVDHDGGAVAGRRRSGPAAGAPRHRRPRAAASAAERPIDPQLKAFWSFQPIRKAAGAAAGQRRLGEDRHRPVRARAAGARRAGAGRHRRQADADPPRDARPHRTAGDSRRDRGVREGRRRRTRSRRSSTGCSRRRATASTGDGSGSTSRATAKTIRAASTPTGRGYAPYPNAYLYRDWVIKAFNDDLPYDQFVKAQIAADQLDEKARVRHLPALGSSRPRARGTTTTARSRSPAPTSATTASTSSRAASSA